MGHQSYVLLCTETTLSNPPSRTAQIQLRRPSIKKSLDQVKFVKVERVLIYLNYAKICKRKTENCIFSRRDTQCVTVHEPLLQWGISIAPTCYYRQKSLANLLNPLNIIQCTYFPFQRAHMQFDRMRGFHIAIAMPVGVQVQSEELQRLISC